MNPEVAVISIIVFGILACWVVSNIDNIRYIIAWLKNGA